MGEFKPCIRDIARALKKGYPLNMSYKLYDRRGKSCMNLNCFQEAVQDFSKAQELARQHLGSDDPKLQTFVKEMDRALQSCSSKANKSQPLDLEQKSLPMLTGKNLSMPALSQAVKIQYSPEVAQFLTINNLAKDSYKLCHSGSNRLWFLPPRVTILKRPGIWNSLANNDLLMLNECSLTTTIIKSCDCRHFCLGNMILFTNPGLDNFPSLHMFP